MPQSNRPQYSTVFIFGGTGSLGHAIQRQWKHKVSNFIVFSRDESKHWKLKQAYPGNKITSVVGDVANYQQVHDALQQYKPEIILVMSAMKHIDYCEQFVNQCLDTNVKGLLNIIRAIVSLNFAVHKLCLVSTDKACAPVNVYGMSKSIAEHIIRNSCQTFQIPLIAVRYGNVIDSSGSVIPVFQSQCQNPQIESLTVTHKDMTRFVISLNESVQLIEDALETAQPGEIYIPIIPSMKIMDLAQLFAKESQKPIKLVGVRNGEKIHESMFSELEYPNIVYREIEGRKRYVLSLMNSIDCSSSINLPKYQNYFSDQGILKAEFLATRLASYLPSWANRPRIAVFGYSGMLGKYVYRYFASKGYPCTKCDIHLHEQITSNAIEEKISMQLNKLEKPYVVINCLGLTNKRTGSDEMFHLVNSTFPTLLSDFCLQQEVTIIHPSTDCVFDGDEQRLNNISYVESTEPNANDVYGQSKALADLHPWMSVIRCSIIGEDDKSSGLLEWLRQHEPHSYVDGFTNHWWNGITCLEWCKIAEHVVHQPFHDTIHIVPPYVVNKYDLLCIINFIYDLKLNVVPTEAGGGTVSRVLSTEKGIIYACESIQNQLRELLEFGALL